MSIELKEYNLKRDFERTIEPKGRVDRSKGSLRFVVQHHLARRDHYDFRLEWEGVLLSWAVPKGPSFNSLEKRLAIKVEDHPIDYKDFEGNIPKGQYGGGVVMLWDEGIWSPVTNVDKGLKEGAIKFELEGKRLKGRWAIIQIESKEGDKNDNWLLIKEKDKFARTEDGIEGYTTSIRTGRTMDEIKNELEGTKNPFDHVNAQLAKAVNSPPEGEDWLFEVKYDGYRIIAYIEGNNARLVSRNGKDYSKHFATIADSLIDFAKGRAMVLDGEMVIADKRGKTDFQELQNYLKNTKKVSLTYAIFDLLALDGEDIRAKKLINRKATLEALMKDAPQNLYYSPHIQGKAKECFDAACKAGMEGIIGKRVDSVYRGARSSDWIKLKCDNRQEFVIGGYTLSDKKTSGISSLILGVYDSDDLIYAGRAGTGFTERTMSELEKIFKDDIRNTPPFKKAPKISATEKVFWLEPKHAAEIKFAEWTKENVVRQASYKGLREDKSLKDIKREGKFEEIDTFLEEEKEEEKMEEIKISNPDKVLFAAPHTTKGDVINYYKKVSKRMLPYIINRVLSIVRCPKGVAQTCFYKKHPGPGSKNIYTIPITNSEGKTDDYFYIKNALGLISEAQMGTLEFHTWGSRIETLNKPDILVFDLDPDIGTGLLEIRQCAEDLKSILDGLSLKSYLKTSGGKGYHVVVPFLTEVTWEEFYNFARRIAEVMEEKWPDRYTINMRKAKRINKVFIDWMRNGRGSTSIAPYSIRAREGAKVSMPISWEELHSIAPADIDMEEAINRIEREDPWADFFDNFR